MSLSTHSNFRMLLLTSLHGVLLEATGSYQPYDYFNISSVVMMLHADNCTVKIIKTEDELDITLINITWDTQPPT